MSPRTIHCLALAVLVLSLAKNVNAVPPLVCDGVIVDAAQPPHKPVNHIEFVPSGPRDADLHEQKLKLIQFLAGPEGLYARLGLKMPPYHAIEDVEGGSLASLVGNNGYPLPFWLDGAKIINSQHTMGGVMEFVPPGSAKTRTVFNRDDMGFYDWAAVLFHASAGHVAFGVTTTFEQARAADTVRDTQRLGRYIEEIKLAHDPREVDLWLQYLATLRMSQDIVSGQALDPQNFVQPPDRSAEGLRSVARPAERYVHPRSPVTNVAQSIVVNLPAELPEWKRHIAREFERLNRYVTGAIPTKIMNEGFAMLMEELIPPHIDDPKMHAHFDQFHYRMSYCCMTPGVTGTMMGPVSSRNAQRYLNNPYWLGREAWRIVRKRFNASIANEAPTLLERDKRFIAYASEKIISRMSDRDFLTMALSDDWIRTHNLAISRAAKGMEIDRNLPPPPPKQFKKPQQNIVASRDPAEVRKFVVRSLTDRRAMAPRVFLTNYNDENRGVVSLEMLDEFGKRYPLDQRTIAPTLFIMNKMLRKPVSMESTHLTVTARDLARRNLDTSICEYIHEELTSPHGWPGIEEFYRTNYPQCFGLVAAPKFIRIRTTVDGDGRVTVETIERARKPKDTGEEPVWSDGVDLVAEPGFQDPRNLPLKRAQPNPELQKRFQAIFDGFVQNMYLEDQGELARLFSHNLTAASAAAAVTGFSHGHGDTFSSGFFDHMPTVPAALAEYAAILSRRLPLALQNALGGKTKFWRRGSKVRVQALPSIPNFAFDRKLLELGSEGVFIDIKPEERKLSLSLPAGRTVHLAQSSAMRAHFGALLDVDGPYEIDSTPEGEGGKFWGEDPKGDKGPGEDGDEDGDPDGDEPGNGTGGDPSDPSVIDVPAELFAQALAEQVELPNLRPKEGMSTNVIMRDRAVANRRNGSPSVPEMTSRATSLGIGALVQKQIAESPTGDLDIDKLIRDAMANPSLLITEGYKRFGPKDYHVIDQRPKIQPDINALVVVMVDFSGSMHQWLNVVKKMTFDLNAILTARYPKVKFLFMPFDAEAHIYETLDGFRTAKLGGGTDYLKPFLKMLEVVFPNYPAATWDVYSVLIGDLLEDKKAEAEAAFVEMKKKSQFTAILHTGTQDFGGWGAFFKTHRDADPYVGLEQIPETHDYYPLLWRKVFRNDDP